ncbi:MAG: porin family protein [Bacteroidota bacterium]
MIGVITALTMVLLLFTMPLSAQTGIRIGFKGGYSMSLQYGITPVDNQYTVSTFSRHAAAGGFMMQYPITESFSIQQEFLYVMKGSRHDIGIPAQSVQTYTLYDLNYFEIPLVFRYTFAHLGTFKLYGTCGYALSILLNGRVQLDGTVEEEGALISFKYADKIRGLDDFDYSLIYGAGVETPFVGKDWFFEYRFTIGWNTLQMPTFPDEPTAPLRNQNYVFALGMYL